MTKLVKPALTAEFVREILDYDFLTGIFQWRYRPDRPRKWNTRYAGQEAGTCGQNGYVYIQVPKPHNYFAHHLAWLHVHGVWPPQQMDHINGVRSDNRISNLRLATDSENSSNKIMQRNNTSGHIGISFDPQRKLWRGRVNFQGKTYDAGFFETAEEAATARADLIAKVHKEFAVKNPAERPRYKHARDNKKSK